MMILQEEPRCDSNYIGYTWDESWLLPYESIRSLLHKFSALNRISLHECKKLFKPESGVEDITELGSKLSLRKLTGIIGVGGNLDSHLVHRIIHPADMPSLLSPYLRTCPICSAHGFHSIFHQVLPIEKCPIHQMGLIITTCGACGSYEMYDSMKIAAGKYSGSPCACAKCGEILWQPYDHTIDSPKRNLLNITADQKARLDALYDWLIASARIVPYGTSMKRWEGMSDLLSKPAPIGKVPHKKSIYQLRGHEVMAYRGMIIGMPPPDAITVSARKDTTYAVVQYGFKGDSKGGKGQRHCHNGTSFEPRFNDSGIIYSETDKALRESLSPVYKSIRRHIAKVFLGGAHRKCVRSIEKAMWWEPGPDSNTQICPWTFAYLFWRRHWEKLERATQPHKYVHWKNFLSIQMADDDQSQNEWASRRIFALECYSTFQECVLLARGMSRQKKFGWDDAQIRGRFIPYWHVSKPPSYGEPLVLSWWGLEHIHTKALKLDVSMRQHRRDMASQISFLQKL